MDTTIKDKILAKNKKLIDMVIERAKRDFSDDIAIVGLTGSFNTGDFHEKSDLDLIIINNTERGWAIGYCFILDDVGYDIYCTPWETRIQAQANLDSPMVSCLIELQILYCAKPEYLEKFNAYKQKALDKLAEPIGIECVNRAKKSIDAAKQEYAAAMISDEIGQVRYAAGCVLYNTVNAIVSLNNTYIKRGTKRYMEELLNYQYLPVCFEKIYMSVIDAKTVEELRFASLQLLKSVDKLYNAMNDEFAEKLTPTYDNLRGTYEELWCNCRNKVIASINANDKSYVFQTALGVQNYLDEMTKDKGTQKFDVMQHFDSDNLLSFKKAFMSIMDEYLTEYKKVGREIERFDTFEQLYEHYMKM